MADDDMATELTGVIGQEAEGEELAPAMKRSTVESYEHFAVLLPLRLQSKEKFEATRCEPRLSGPINFQLCLLPARSFVKSETPGIARPAAAADKSPGRVVTHGGKQLKTGAVAPCQQNITVFCSRLSLTEIILKCFIKAADNADASGAVSSVCERPLGLKSQQVITPHLLC